ncbi:MAG TPA: hypothetical protein V6D29_14690 [Leptolyngbyaceae cyanobacterium]
MFQSPESGTNVPTVPPTRSSKREPQRRKICHVLYGDIETIDRVIKHLHTLRYADPNDWSDIIPSGKDHQWMAVLTKHILLE